MIISQVIAEPSNILHQIRRPGKSPLEQRGLRQPQVNDSDWGVPLTTKFSWQALTSAKKSLPKEWGVEKVLANKKPYVSKSTVSRRVSITAWEAIRFCIESKQADLAQHSWQSVVLVPQQLVINLKCSTAFWVIASSLYAARMWPVRPLLHTNENDEKVTRYACNLNDPWVWISVLDFSDWKVQPYRWVVNTVAVDENSFFVMEPCGVAVPALAIALGRRWPQKLLVHQRKQFLKMLNISGHSVEEEDAGALAKLLDGYDQQVVDSCVESCEARRKHEENLREKRRKTKEAVFPARL
jgi:hypothetical protein